MDPITQEIFDWHPENYEQLICDMCDRIYLKERSSCAKKPLGQFCYECKWHRDPQIIREKWNNLSPRKKLEFYRKEDLYRVIRNNQVRGYSKLNKPELIELILFHMRKNGLVILGFINLI